MVFPAIVPSRTVPRRQSERTSAEEAAADRFSTPLALRRWVRDLSGCPWFDLETCAELIEAVCRHKGWLLDEA